MSKKNSQVRTRRLGLETLEQRAMLAGNITVSVTDGLLQVAGDSSSNDVNIRQIKQTFTGEWPGVKLEISGINRRNQTTTLVNGQTSPVIVEGVKNVRIGLGSGDNMLRVGNIPSGGGTTNQVAVNLPGSVVIGSGGGRDDMLLYVVNHAQVGVYSGGGNDKIVFSGATLNRLTVKSDPPNVAGNDFVELRAVGSKGAIAIDTGNGNDAVVVTSSSVLDGAFTVALGLGDDALDIRRESTWQLRPILNGPTNVQTGNGSDTVYLDALVNAQFVADLGQGVDIFNCFATSTVILEVSFGDDDDRTSVGGQLAGIDFDGGSGYDVLFEIPNSDLGTESIVNFEEINRP